MNGTIMIVITAIWAAFMTFLSHQNGYKSGKESRWISERIRIPDYLIRRSAHVFVYMVFTILLLLSMKSLGIYMWIGVVIAVIFSIIDEATKPLCVFRHWSSLEVLLNLSGIAIGAVLGAIIIMRVV